MTFEPVGDFACRVIPWPGKDTEFEFDQDTRKSLIRIILEEKAALVLLGTSRIQITTLSSKGTVPGSDVVGQDFSSTIYEVQGDPQVFHRRMSISHVEAIIRALEG